ncbi:MAG TPA: ATP phosphoribosyltransferase [Gemmatimonadaceae bacterium]|nr:ATP phosphoribosyltransferase [Gemmatimonadaceae bacterium]
MLRVALPNKGRLAEDVRELFGDAGLEVRARGERALVASLGGEFEAILVRAKDIPEFVADGAADVGVTGWDLVCESERDIGMLLDLEFGGCRLVVAARDDSGISTLDDLTGSPRVATVFPQLSRNFFEKAGKPVTIVPVSGATEIAPHLGIADIIVDLTSSGSTLRVHQLHEVATVLESSARLICSVNPSSKGIAKQTDELAEALSSVLRARDKRYVMANVPRASLDEARLVMPGVNGPTVIDILDGGTYVAVHAVVAQSAIYRTVADLKALGAQGILVTRIERLMP